nr:uncharacterized protein LOC133575758 isoform X2 [Nerophis lumbriciformis]
MCKLQMLRALVDQRLTAAVEEIFVVFERTIAEYEAELSRTKEENNRLLDAVFKKHQVVLHGTGSSKACMNHKDITGLMSCLTTVVNDLEMVLLRNVSDQTRIHLGGI